MNTKLKNIGRIGAVLASLFCLAGGLVMVAFCLSEGATNDKSANFWIGFGLYFIGKGFFVGPMLWLATEQVCRPKNTEGEKA